MAETAVNIDSCAPEQNKSALTIYAVLENEVVLREIFKHLSSRDLLALSAVSSSSADITRTYIRAHRNFDAKLPKNKSSCQSLLQLEADLTQLSVIPFTGLWMYFSRCTAKHDEDLNNLDELFQNLLNRLELRRLWVHDYENRPDSPVCKLTAKLMERLCEKNSSVIRSLSINCRGWNMKPTLINLVHGGRLWSSLKTLTYNNDGYLSLEEKFYLESLISRCPVLKEINTPHIGQIVPTRRQLIKNVSVEIQHLSAWSIQDVESVRLHRLELANRTENNKVSPRCRQVLNKLLENGSETLETVIIRGPGEFPRWSKESGDVPGLINCKYLQISTSLEDREFLREMNHVIGVMMPNLKVVSLQHSPCNNNHSVEPLSEDSPVVPNTSVRVLKIEKFDVDMGVLMTSFKQYVPNVRELHIFDCNSSALDWISQWPELECIVVASGKSSFWWDNADHIIVGSGARDDEDNTRAKDDAGIHDAPTKLPLTSLRNLRRFYIVGGAEADSEDTFLSSAAVSLLLDQLPRLVLSVLPGHRGYVLKHLLPLANTQCNSWCSPTPFNVDQYFQD